MFLDFHNNFISRVSAEVFCKKKPFLKENSQENTCYGVFLGQLVYETLVSSCIRFGVFFITFANVPKTFNSRHCVKRVRIRSYSGPHFNLSVYRISPYSVRIQKNPGKMWTRITPNKDSFYVVRDTSKNVH